MTLTNKIELINELTTMLMQFAKDCNRYQTDVYFYYNNRDQTGILDTFTNVGGNSWLDDDHITIYTDKEHYDDGAYSFFTDSDVIADILGITEEQLVQETKEHYGYDDDEDVEYCEIKRYVQSVEEYNNEIWEAYYEVIEENAADYYEQAEEIINNVEATM